MAKCGQVQPHCQLKAPQNGNAHLLTITAVGYDGSAVDVAVTHNCNKPTPKCGHKCLIYNSNKKLQTHRNKALKEVYNMYFKNN